HRRRLLGLGGAGRGRELGLVGVIEQPVCLQRGSRRKRNDDECEQDQDQAHPAALARTRYHRSSDSNSGGTREYTVATPTYQCAHGVITAGGTPSMRPPLPPSYERPC